MKIVGWADGSGARWWRLEAPFKYLRRLGHDAYMSANGINDKEIQEADIVVLHNVVNLYGIADILAARDSHNTRLIVDVDDALDLPKSNPHHTMWDKTEGKFIIARTCEFADVVTTTTPYMQKKLSAFNDTVKITPNSLDFEWFNVQKNTNQTDNVRIGWAGGISHMKDLEMIVPVLDELLDENEKIRLILCGDDRLKRLFRNKDKVQIEQAVPIQVYPQKLSSMMLDIGIAPLVNNEFNRCKSPIKAMEYASCGVPCIGSPTIYGDYAPFATIAKDKREWKDKLNQMIHDREYRISRGDEAYRYVHENCDIRNTIKSWIDAYGLEGKTPDAKKIQA